MYSSFFQINVETVKKHGYWSIKVSKPQLIVNPYFNIHLFNILQYLKLHVDCCNNDNFDKLLINCTILQHTPKSYTTTIISRNRPNKPFPRKLYKNSTIMYYLLTFTVLKNLNTDIFVHVQTKVLYTI